FVEENSKTRETMAQDTSQFIEGQLRASESRLNALEGRLREMKETFMGRLPEQTNANLAMVSAMQRQLESNATTTRGEQDRLLKDREATKLRVADLHRQATAITAQIAQYSGRVEAAPRVEQQLVSLQRAYDLERGAYQDLSQKKQSALLNEELQRKQGGEQFAVLVPAGLPSEPFKPKPLRVMLMAIAAGLVLGGAFAFGRDYLDRAVHDAPGVRDEFEMPVLAEIPRIEPDLG